MPERLIFFRSAYLWFKVMMRAMFQSALKFIGAPIISPKWLVKAVLMLVSWLTLSSVTAQTAPKYSNEFLTIGVGARAIGMGGAVTSSVTGVNAGYWNPAGLVQATNKYEVSLMHAQYFAGLANYDYGAFSTKLDTNASLGFSFIRFAVDNIPDTRFLIVADVIDYSRIRRFSSADNAFMVSYARRNVGLPGLNIGGSAKIIYRNAGVFATAWGFGIDLGAQYRKGNWLFGAHLRDVTTTFNAWSFNTAEVADVFTRTGNTIPESSLELTMPRLVVGAAYQANWRKFSGMASADLEATTDGRRNTLISTSLASIDPKAGVELGYDGLVYLRGGINQVQQIKSLNGRERSWVMQPNLGLGVRIYKLSIDYALSNLGTTSEAVYSHIFSLKYGFDKAR